MDTARRGGVLVRLDGSLRFVPASVVVGIAPPPRLSPVPGAPPDLLGITLHEGAVIPVLAIGAARAEMIVCQHAGELLGLVGAELVRTGSFDPVPDRPDLVEHEGQRAAPLDVDLIYARVQTTPRPVRWGA